MIMKRMIFATFILISLASPIYANHCSLEMKKIEAALKTAMLGEAKKKKVTELYNKGKAEHEAGNH